MEEIIVSYRPEVELFLKDLNYILFQKEYFGFLEDSFDYMDRLVDFIELNLPLFPAKNTPETLIHLGSKYVFFKANQNTTWYIFLKILIIIILSHSFPITIQKLQNFFDVNI